MQIAEDRIYNELNVNEFDPFCFIISQQPSFQKQNSEFCFEQIEYPEPTEKSHISFSSTKSQKLIQKPSKKVKYDLKNPETKNITKFFGAKLFIFIQKMLHQQIKLQLPNVDAKKDLSLVQLQKCSTIKSLSLLWMQSQNIKSISENYFRSAEPILDIMASKRISNHSVALKFIPSYLRGISEPEKFRKLNWTS